jgi:ribosomal protein S18 acetylase RimI-like enzyme
MNSSHHIERTSAEDINFVYNLYDEAIQYQEKKGLAAWQGFDRSVITEDINHGHHYKLLARDQIALVFSVRYSDEIIWRDLDKGDAIYLHRIAVNPAFKGQKLFAGVLGWATQHAKENKLKFVRMDTWAHNSSLINYYQSFGFHFVENFTTPDTPHLPVQNRNLSLALLQIAL